MVVVVVGGAVTEGEVEEMGEEERETFAVGRQKRSDFQLLPTHT